jgi:hypothetical protein
VQEFEGPIYETAELRTGIIRPGTKWQGALAVCVIFSQVAKRQGEESFQRWHMAMMQV